MASRAALRTPRSSRAAVSASSTASAAAPCASANARSVASSVSVSRAVSGAVSRRAGSATAASSARRAAVASGSTAAGLLGVEAEERQHGRLVEVHAPRVVERPRVVLEALDALAEDAGHEERVVADVAAHIDLALGAKVRGGLVPCGLRFEQEIDHRLQPRGRHAGREEPLGAGEAREEIAEVGGHGLVVEREITKARPDCPIEESPKLHGSDNNVEFVPVTDAPRARLPWLLVAGSILLALLLAYTLFGAYLPAKRRVASLERELREVYAREAELQTKVAKNEQSHSLREQQLLAVSGERDALARRLEELERELAIARGTRRR